MKVHPRSSRMAETVLRSRWSAVLGPGAAFEAQVWAARALLRAESGRPRADGTRTGERLLEVVPDAIGRLAARLPHGTVLVSGTNGKSTTTMMVAAILEAHGFAPVSNRIGSNQPGGIAAELIAATRRGGGMDGSVGAFEVDELWLDRVMDHLVPRVVVLGNLFRDQLDRTGELDLVAERWSRLVSRTPPATRFVLCADDPRVAALPAASALYFGLEDDDIAAPALPHAADPAHCGSCGRRHDYGRVFLSHLGRWRCSTCGTGRPRPQVWATDVRADGTRGSRFVLHTPDGSEQVTLRVPGIYNVENALAAAAAGHALGVPLATAAGALSLVGPGFGRGEMIDAGSVRLLLLLAKNPTGLDQVAATLADRAVFDLVFVLNDAAHDARDVSWIWDADLEAIAGRIRHAVCGGTRAADAAVRLKYAGVPPDAIEVAGSADEAMGKALALRGEIPVVANYTAMLDARDALVERGLAETVWR